MISFELATFSDLENIVATYNSTIESRMVTADLEPVSVESKISWFNWNSKQKVDKNLLTLSCIF
ncbi:MAG: hypothetical protein LCH32_07345 [Bacteroidetes bacterium]|nr:hypothetical protein [Bacteroidota bacterium]